MVLSNYNEPSSRNAFWRSETSFDICSRCYATAVQPRCQSSRLLSIKCNWSTSVVPHLDPNVCLSNFMDLMDSNFMVPMCVSPTLRLVGNYFCNNFIFIWSRQFGAAVHRGVGRCSGKILLQIGETAVPSSATVGDTTVSYNWRHRRPPDPLHCLRPAAAAFSENSRKGLGSKLDNIR